MAFSYLRKYHTKATSQSAEMVGQPPLRGLKVLEFAGLAPGAYTTDICR
jgi:hypothetical protein